MDDLYALTLRISGAVTDRFSQSDSSGQIDIPGTVELEWNNCKKESLWKDLELKGNWPLDSCSFEFMKVRLNLESHCV